MITEKQVILLNDMYKTMPQLRNWYSENGEGLGNILLEQQQQIASIDTTTIEPVTIIPSSPSFTSFFTIGANKQTALLIDVTAAFDNLATITIGSLGSPTAYADVQHSDLTKVGKYIITPTVIFNVPTNIGVYFNSSSAVSGSLTISIMG